MGKAKGVFFAVTAQLALTVSAEEYCANSACGAALLSTGWNLVTEFGSLSPRRFVSETSNPQVDSSEAVQSAGWTLPNGALTYVNYGRYKILLCSTRAPELSPHQARGCPQLHPYPNMYPNLYPQY